MLLFSVFPRFGLRKMIALFYFVSTHGLLERADAQQHSRGKHILTLNYLWKLSESCSVLTETFTWISLHRIRLASTACEKGNSKKAHSVCGTLCTRWTWRVGTVVCNFVRLHGGSLTQTWILLMNVIDVGNPEISPERWHLLRCWCFFV